MNKRERNILIVSMFLIIAGSVVLLTNKAQEVERIDGGDTAAFNTETVNFQGTTSNTKIINGSVMLDSTTVLNKEQIAEGTRILGSSGEKVYITQPNGDAAVVENGNTQKLDIKTTYGGAIVTLNSQLTMIYADQNKDVYKRRLGTKNEQKILSNALEVISSDTNKDGLPDSAQIRLTNGTTFQYATEDPEIQRDWDKDGYKERFYIKNGKLMTYDSKHGIETLTDAVDFSIEENTLYLANDGKIYRLKFDQEYVESGTYTSRLKEFNKTLEIAQIITRADTDNGNIQLKIITPFNNETFRIKDGHRSLETSIFAREYRMKIELTGKNGNTPELNEIEVITLDE